MKNIKDYLHFYIGCTISLHQSRFSEGQEDTTFTLDGVRDKKVFWVKELDNCWYEIENDAHRKPIDLLHLRPLSDMADHEKRTLACLLFKPESEFIQCLLAGEISSSDSVGFKITYTPPKSHPLDPGFMWIKMRKLFPEQFFYMLSLQFDLFGLIEAGLAIDKTKTVTA